VISAVLFFVSFTSRAGVVLGGYAGQSSDTDHGIEKLKGSLVGGKIGYRWGFIALEIAHTSYNLKSKTGQADDYYINKAEIKGGINDLMVRFYPFSFISLVAGYSQANLNTDIQLSNVNGDPTSSVSEKGSSLFDSGSLWGAAIHIPLYQGIEIFGEYVQRKLSSALDGTMGSEIPDLKLNEWHAGITFTWGQGKSNRKKAKTEEKTYVF
jgi:hypothetical protein